MYCLDLFNYLHSSPTRIILTWIPLWKKAQIWGATSSQAFPIVLNLSSSSNVVLAYSTQSVCAYVWEVSVSELERKENKNASTTQLLQLRLTALQYSNQIQTCSTHYTWHEHGKSIRCTHVYACVCVHNIQKLKHTHTVTVLLISCYIPFPHYTLCENQLCKDNTHIPTQRIPAGPFR